MSIQNLSIVFSPTMRISHRVFFQLFTNWEIFFGHVRLKKWAQVLLWFLPYLGQAYFKNFILFPVLFSEGFCGSLHCGKYQKFEFQCLWFALYASVFRYYLFFTLLNSFLFKKKKKKILFQAKEFVLVLDRILLPM